MKIYHRNRQTNDELFTDATHSRFICNVYAHGGSHKINECATNGIFIFIRYLLMISSFHWIIYLKILISIPVGKKANHRFTFDCKIKQRKKIYGQYVFTNRSFVWQAKWKNVSYKIECNCCRSWPGKLKEEKKKRLNAIIAFWINQMLFSCCLTTALSVLIHSGLNLGHLMLSNIVTKVNIYLKSWLNYRQMVRMALRMEKYALHSINLHCYFKIKMEVKLKVSILILSR